MRRQRTHSCDHRLHGDGEEHELHVRDRPDVIRTVTHEEVTKEELGGAMTHNERSGVAHFAADNDRECILLIRELLSFVPNNNLDEAPRVATADPVDRADEALDALVPQSANQPYDMRDVIDAVVDDRNFLEVHEHFARNILVGRRGSAAAPSASWPTSRHTSRGRWISTPRSRGRGSSGSARLQHPADHVRGRARLPAGNRGEYGSIIRNGAKLLRIRGSNRSEIDRDHAQGVRRGVLRHVASTYAPT